MTSGSSVARSAVVAGVLGIAAALAVTSLVGDSATFDETSHLASGASYLRTGDYRLAPEHPPLPKMWAALPCLVLDHEWPAAGTAGWTAGDPWVFGRTWLFELNDPDPLLTAARCMMVVLLLATCLAVHATASRLFGPGAGLLALVLAAFSPTLLAHGRLVTTDLPVTLGFLVVLLAFARCLERPSLGRVALFCLAFAALTLSKLSWPLVLPAMLVMAAWSVFTRGRAGAVAGALAGAAAASVLAVWACYGFHYSPFQHDVREGARMLVRTPDGRPPATSMDDSWEYVLADMQGRPLTGPVTTAVQLARDHHLLPEAYLFGIALTNRSTKVRSAYLMGEYSETGWLSYFPIAFAIKTPVAILLLASAGVVALVLRRVGPIGDPVLLAGLVAFAVLYAGVAAFGTVDIGHRHLLPIYPAVLVVAGAAVAWGARPIGRYALALAVGWLVVTNLLVHPHYLAYFNEIVGGPARGHEYLTDSNLDWGQDLKRLASWVAEHGESDVQLAYFGMAVPEAYGLTSVRRIGGVPGAGESALRAGTYVVSATVLSGVYRPISRDGVWQDPANVAAYRRLHETFSSGDAGPEARASRPYFEWMYFGRFLRGLRHREPDDRIGYSLFVYRLTDAEINELTAP